MKRIALTLLLACAAYGISFAQQAVSIDQAIRQASAYMADNLPRNSKVAVLNIESETQKISEYIMEELSALLVNGRSLVVVDRRDLELIRQEERFQMSGEVSDETAQRVGQKLGAQTIISGSFASLGGGYRMHVRAIAVETAQVQGLTTI
jgi:TolB-like protein